MKAEPRRKQPETRPHCYLCGALDSLTEDHIPPEGFFPPGDRADLITAPLCESCHSPLTKTDESMRVFLAASGGSDASKWIWRNKVVGSTFLRSPTLHAYIRQHHFRPLVESATGRIAAGLLTYPQADAIPFIRRLTKGFLYTFHPEYDYFSDHFAVGYNPPVDDLLPMASLLSPVVRGNGVFRLWHGITADTRDAGMCVYLFYNAVCFVCLHGQRDEFKQEFELP